LGSDVRPAIIRKHSSIESEINFTMPSLALNQNYYFGYTVQLPGDQDAADDRTIIEGVYRG